MDLEAARDAASVRDRRPELEERPGGASFLDRVFRFRYPLHVLVYVAGFGISWGMARGLRSQRVWLALPEAISKASGLRLDGAVIGVNVCVIVLATSAALLRTWGTAYLGATVVMDPALRGGGIAVSGPYRYVRNPLYIGTVLHSLAICILMTWGGAAFTMGAILVLQWALVAAEERFLSREQPEAYAAYCGRVPRFVPRLLHPATSSGGDARWGRAVLEESYMWGAAIAFAAFESTYDSVPILQGLLVSLGVSIVVRGLMGKQEPAV